jgi:translocator protein
MYATAIHAGIWRARTDGIRAIAVGRPGEKEDHIAMLSLIGWIALCFGAAAFGSRYMPGPWYAALRKPVWNPPNSIFAPVWSALYLMMAVAAWRVWNHGGALAQLRPLGLFLVQLVLNALWTWVFFGLRAPGAAFAHIVVMWIAIALTLITFWRLDAIAGILLTPYLAWVSFAAVLNFTVWRLNA